MTSPVSVLPRQLPCQDGAMTGDTELTVRLAIVKGLEESLEVLTAEACAALDDDLPAYGGVPRDDLHTSTRRTLGIVIGAIRAGRPDVRLEDVDPAMVRRRIERGVTADEMVHASRRVAAVVLDHLQMQAQPLGLPEGEVLGLTNLVWAVTDAMGVRVSEAYRTIDVQTAMFDALRRDRFMQSLVEHEFSPAELEHEAQALGLDAQTRYRGVWARPVDGVPERDPEQIRTILVSQLRASGRGGLLGQAHGAWLGVVVGGTLPRLRDIGVVVGIGPELDLAHAAESLASARSICAAAIRRGAPGVFELPDVTWRVAVQEDDSVTAVLRRRYLDPVVGEHNTRDTVTTLRAFLAADRNVQQAAVALNIHPNTLRYRLARFEELTGRSLTSTEVIVEVSWLLEAL